MPWQAFAESSLIGIWQRPGNDVYIQIYEDGSAFQCRLDGAPAALYKYIAEGKVISKDQVEWGKMLSFYNGNPIQVQGLPENFSWGVETFTFNSDGTLSLYSDLAKIQIELHNIDSLPEECADERKAEVS